MYRGKKLEVLQIKLTQVCCCQKPRFVVTKAIFKEVMIEFMAPLTDFLPCSHVQSI